jgi:hypothetical protein
MKAQFAALVVALALPACASGDPGLASDNPTTVPPTEDSPVVGAAEPSVGSDGTVTFDFAANYTILIAGDDAVWGVADRPDGREIFRIDPATNEVTTVVTGLPVLPNPIHGMAVNGSIWISSWDADSVTQYDAATGLEVATVPVGQSPIEPVYAYGDVWTLNHHGGSVSRIDVEAETVAATIDVAELGRGGPLTADAGGGFLWVAAPNTPAVVAIDPETNAVARTIELDTACTPGVSYFGDALWVRGCPGGVQILDPETGEQLGHSGTEMPTSEGRLEVGDRAWIPGPIGPAGSVTFVAVDPDSSEVVDEFELATSFEEDLRTTVGFGSMWLYSGASGHVVRLPVSTLPGS